MLERSINSIKELEQFASELTEIIHPNSVILLNGEMGAGKTSFVQAFSRLSGVKQAVRSPTFIVHSEYKANKNLEIHHLDLYRLENPSELKELNIKDSLNDDSYIFIEWADKFEDELKELFSDKNVYKLDFEIVDENIRSIKFEKLES